jgi:hypothetical protein
MNIESESVQMVLLVGIREERAESLGGLPDILIFSFSFTIDVISSQFLRNPFLLPMWGQA